jgi:hypothetical protein
MVAPRRTASKAQTRRVGSIRSLIGMRSGAPRALAQQADHRGANGAVIAFMILFGLHNILFFLCTMGSIGNLLLAGKTDGQLNLIPLLLAWICGSMMFGLAGILAGLLRRS